MSDAAQPAEPDLAFDDQGTLPAVAGTPTPARC